MKRRITILVAFIATTLCLGNAYAAIDLTDSEAYRLNHSSKIAGDVQLGTLLQNAANFSGASATDYVSRSIADGGSAAIDITTDGTALLYFKDDVRFESADNYQANYLQIEVDDGGSAVLDVGAGPGQTAKLFFVDDVRFEGDNTQANYIDVQVTAAGSAVIDIGVDSGQSELLYIADPVAIDSGDTPEYVIIDGATKAVSYDPTSDTPAATIVIRVNGTTYHVPAYTP